MTDKIFKTEKEAEKYFKAALFDPEQEANIENCEICGQFSISRANDPDGAIVGAYVSEAEGIDIARVCEKCSELEPKEVLKIINGANPGGPQAAPDAHLDDIGG